MIATGLWHPRAVRATANGRQANHRENLTRGDFDQFTRHLAHQPTDGDWQRLLQLYRPLLRTWMVRAGVATDDIDDLTQDLLLVVLRKVSQFKRMHQGAFRSWLRSILAYRLRDYYRAHRHRPVATGGSNFVRQLAELKSPDSALSRQWDREHDEYLLSALMSLVQKHFTP